MRLSWGPLSQILEMYNHVHSMQWPLPSLGLRGQQYRSWSSHQASRLWAPLAHLTYHLISHLIAYLIAHLATHLIAHLITHLITHLNAHLIAHLTAHPSAHLADYQHLLASLQGQCFVESGSWCYEMPFCSWHKTFWCSGKSVWNSLVARLLR